MKKVFTPVLSPSEPDPGLLAWLTLIHHIFLAVVFLVAAVTFCGWFWPALDRLLPAGWTGMHAHSAAAFLLSSASFYLSESRCPKPARIAGRLLALPVAYIAISVLQAYGRSGLAPVDSFWGMLTEAPTTAPTRMAPQSAIAFLLLSLLMVLIRVRWLWIAYLADLIASGLSFVILLAVSGYLAGAMRLFGLSLSVRSAPQTLSCLVLLTFVAFWRRAEYGFFSILLRAGSGSKIARILTPFLIVLPFLREATRAHSLRRGLIQPADASAIDTALTVMAAFMLLLFLAWRINKLERRILDLSLRDGLTGVYNRQGFFLLGSQARQLAERARAPFSVVFLDIDGLKQVNDSFGHEAGSALIAETGELLKRTLRETDVVGRIGGDEFVVAGQLGEEAVQIAIERLQRAASLANAKPGRIYNLIFSVGSATSKGRQLESLDALMSRADAAMYREKQGKSTSRIANGG